MWPSTKQFKIVINVASARDNQGLPSTASLYKLDIPIWIAIKEGDIMRTFREKSSKKKKKKKEKGRPGVCEALFGRGDTWKDKNTFVLRRRNLKKESTREMITASEGTAGNTSPKHQPWVPREDS
jgi:hypothetical protein